MRWGRLSNYDASARMVKAHKGKTDLWLTLGQKTAFVGGQAYELDEPARLVNGYTLAPVRFIGEVFGGQVTWDGIRRTVTITATP